MCWRRVLKTRSTICLFFLAAICGIYVFYCIAKSIDFSRAPLRENGMLFYNIQEVTSKPANQRIVFIGAGPTALGALYRLHDTGIIDLSHIQIIVLEQALEPGGLASSTRDNNSFLWDNGGHVVFSHYDYFDAALNSSVHEWNFKRRASFAFMMGGDGKRRFIPYPVQNNLHFMDEEYRNISLKGLEEATKLNQVGMRKAENFKDWLLRAFGKGLFDVFMNRYNTKVWTVDPSEMNSAWVGERVAVPDIHIIKSNIADAKAKRLKEETWGPNRLFRFPKYDGSGGIWKRLAAGLPQGWFHYGHTVTELNLENKQIKVELDERRYYILSYDVLVSTAPLDSLVGMVSDEGGVVEDMKDLAGQLLYSHTHVIGIGLLGRPPAFLQGKSWIYFPDSDAPFYRATVFSSYADDNVPNERTDLYWSLMCEVAQPKTTTDQEYWTKKNLIKETIRALNRYKYISKSAIVSKYYRRLDHGYPIPSLNRDYILNQLQPWLRSHSVYSRGRFGGWRYEVGNQDHSFMQGVEMADYILSNTEEETYPNPELVNTMKSSNRTLRHSRRNKRMDYQLVVSHMNEDLSWLIRHSDHGHVYHRVGRASIPDFRFQLWSGIEDVGCDEYSFLFHIVTNYHLLAYITVFLQGSGCRSSPKVIDNVLKETKVTGISFNDLKSSNNWGKQEMESISLTDCKYSLGELWEVHFGKGFPDAIQWSDDLCFAVSRDRILRKPRIFYEKLMVSLSDYVSPLRPQHVSRLWHTIFTH